MQIRETYTAIRNFQKEIYDATDWDTVQKIYRQCRIWVRCQVAYSHSITAKQGRYVNNKVNLAKKDVLRKWRRSHNRVAAERFKDMRKQTYGYQSENRYRREAI